MPKSLSSAAVGTRHGLAAFTGGVATSTNSPEAAQDVGRASPTLPCRWTHVKHTMRLTGWTKLTSFPPGCAPTRRQRGDGRGGGRRCGTPVPRRGYDARAPRAGDPRGPEQLANLTVQRHSALLPWGSRRVCRWHLPTDGARQRTGLRHPPFQPPARQSGLLQPTAGQGGPAHPGKAPPGATGGLHERHAGAALRRAARGRCVRVPRSLPVRASHSTLAPPPADRAPAAPAGARRATAHGVRRSPRRPRRSRRCVPHDR
jgi:hypothetical protein